MWTDTFGKLIIRANETNETKTALLAKCQRFYDSSHFNMTLEEKTTIDTMINNSNLGA